MTTPFVFGGIFGTNPRPFWKLYRPPGYPIQSAKLSNCLTQQAQFTSIYGQLFVKQQLFHKFYFPSERVQTLIYKAFQLCEKLRFKLFELCQIIAGQVVRLFATIPD